MIAPFTGNHKQECKYRNVYANEADYVKRYADCAESVLVVVMAENKVVGASTAMPLIFDIEPFKKPFIDNGIDIKKVFYLGESVLLPEYRGKNIYRQFFQEREAAALEYGCTITAFATVDRASDDPRRPTDYVPLDKIWEHFGYKKHPEIATHIEWKEVGEKAPAKNRMVFWLKNSNQHQI
jgi:GNAT superfamily N-acetyltransferase